MHRRVSPVTKRLDRAITRGRRLEVDEAAPPNEGGGSMSNAIKTSKRSSGEAQSEYMKGGKGRKDEVGKSGIYPASSPDAPGDSVLRAEGELAGHAGASSTRRRNPSAPIHDEDSG